MWLASYFLPVRLSRLSLDGKFSLVPVAPAAIISNPAIKSPIAIINPANAAPKIGETSVMIPMIINNAPTPIRKALFQPDSFPENPSTMLAEPPKRSAMPIKIVMIHAVPTGYAIARPANMMINIPSPMLAPLPLIWKKMPAIIFSIPRINKIMASINTTDTNVAAGNASA